MNKEEIVIFSYLFFVLHIQSGDYSIHKIEFADTCIM